MVGWFSAALIGAFRSSLFHSVICSLGGPLSHGSRVACVAGVQRGGRGKVECEREARSLGATIARRALVALRARIQLPPSLPFVRRPRGYSPVVVFFDRGDPRFWNFYSTIPVDVVRVTSYMNCLFDPTCVVMRVTINKLYFVPEWLVSGVVGVL